MPHGRRGFPASPEISQIRGGITNVYLVRTTPPMLIDSGGKADLAELEKGLRAHGVSIEQIKIVLLTHGHADHAGLAA